MDKFKVNIALIGAEVKDNIESIEKIDRLSIEITDAKLDDASEYAKADVVVVGLESVVEHGIDNIKKHCADYTKFVLYAQDTKRSSLKKYNKQDFYDIWVADDAMLSYRVEHFLLRMRDILDFELASNQLNLLIDSVPYLVWFKDVSGEHTKVNEYFCNVVGKTKEQVIGQQHSYIWDISDEEYAKGDYNCLDSDEIVEKNQGTFRFDEKVKIGDKMRQLIAYKSAIVNRLGETIGTVGLAEDVTEAWNINEEFNSLVNNIPMPMMIVDANYNFINANHPFYNTFSVDKENLQSFTISSFGQSVLGSDITYSSFSKISTEAMAICHGKAHKFLIEKSPIFDVFHTLVGYFYFFQDVTIQREYEAKLVTISETDDLTNINNRKAIRAYFDTHISRVVKKETSLGVILVDIDCFKQFNDAYGHIAGDGVLVTFGEILSSIANDHVFVGRFGGEEFIIITQEKTLEEVEELATILKALIDRREIENKKSTVSKKLTVSVGVAYYDKVLPSQSIANIIENADSVLRQAKNTGRNKIVVKEINN